MPAPYRRLRGSPLVHNTARGIGFVVDYPKGASGRFQQNSKAAVAFTPWKQLPNQQEPFEKIVAGQVILPANLRFCLFDIGCDLVKNAV